MSLVDRYFSTLFMNTISDYSDDYYVFNHLRHLHSWYGHIIKMYYCYLASFCYSGPARLSRGATVLDIGCGVGTLVSAFRGLGYCAYGVDVMTAAIRHSLCPVYCDLVASTAHLPFQDHSFDLVVSREVLEHIPEHDLDDCILEWDRVSRGVMIHIIAVSERGISATHDPTHCTVKPERWWISKFHTHGYSAIKRPFRFFWSPFGSSGYFMFVKQ